MHFPHINRTPSSTRQRTDISINTSDALRNKTHRWVIITHNCVVWMCVCQWRRRLIQGHHTPHVLYKTILYSSCSRILDIYHIYWDSNEIMYNRTEKMIHLLASKWSIRWFTLLLLCYRHSGICRRHISRVNRKHIRITDSIVHQGQVCRVRNTTRKTHFDWFHIWSTEAYC